MCRFRQKLLFMSALIATHFALGVRAQEPAPTRAAFANLAFSAVECAGAQSTDSCVDAPRDYRNVVGDGTSPSVQVARNAEHLFVRIRLENDPRQMNGLRAFSWAFGIDTDHDGQFEAFAIVRGVGNDDRLEIYDQDPDNGVSPDYSAAPGAPDTALRPIDTPLIGGTPNDETWVDVSEAVDAVVCPDDPTPSDYWLTVAVPFSVLQSYGALGEGRLYAGSSSNFTGIDADLACENVAPVSCAADDACASDTCLAQGQCAPMVTPVFMGCLSNDNTPFDGVDDGCTLAQPHCVLQASQPVCSSEPEIDASVPDGGPIEDASISDAATDASWSDAELPQDAAIDSATPDGTPHDSAMIDSGSRDGAAAPPKFSLSGGCAARGASLESPVWLLAMLLWVASRRRFI